MPEFTVKEVHLPELHLPEINRDEIVRSLSGVRLPDVDLARARRGRINVPMVSLTSADVGRLIAAAAAVARFVRPAPSRSRWLVWPIGRRSRSPVARIVRPRSTGSGRLFVFGAIVVVGFAAWAALTKPAIRQRLVAAPRQARERIDAWRVARQDHPDDAGPPVAFTAAEDDPDGPGANAKEGDGVPAFEERGLSS